VTGTGLSADLGEVHPPSMVKPVVEVEVVIVAVVEDLAVVGAAHPTSKGAAEGGSVVGGVLTMLRVPSNWSNPHKGVTPKKPPKSCPSTL